MSSKGLAKGDYYGTHNERESGKSMQLGCLDDKDNKKYPTCVPWIWWKFMCVYVYIYIYIYIFVPFVNCVYFCNVLIMLFINEK